MTVITIRQKHDATSVVAHVANKPLHCLIRRNLRKAAAIAVPADG